MMHFTHSTSNKANPFKRHRTLTSISSFKKKKVFVLTCQAILHFQLFF